MVELGGRLAQDLGFSRIAGQMLMYLYLQPAECSLDQIERDLGLSKAAVSVAARQLESFGLIRRVWKQGDRKSYYRSAEHLGAALRQGALALLRAKLEMAGAELSDLNALLERANGPQGATPETAFLKSRVRRAKEIRDRVASLLNHRWLDAVVR